MGVYVGDVEVIPLNLAHTLYFEPGTVVVDDRGYNDYRLFAMWSEQGVYFVTRIKDNALYQGIESRPLPQNGSILKDQIITLSGAGAWDKCPYALRRIEVWDAEKQQTFVFLTNQLFCHRFRFQSFLFLLRHLHSPSIFGKRECNDDRFRTCRK